MLYSKLTTKARISLNEYVDFDIPIIGHDTFYQQAPLPGVPMTPIRLGRTEGYDTIDLFWQEVCSFLGFNPYKIKEFQINTRGLQTAVPDVINAFMGVTETYNDNHGNFWPSRDPDTGGNATGTTWLAVGYSSAQATFANTQYGTGDSYAYNFHNVIKEYTGEQGADIAITSEFDIWPEACIKSGYIDVQHLNSDNGLYRFVHLIFHIYRIEATQKYNYAIYLESGNTTQAQTDYMNDVLNTAPLGHVYNPANPLDNKQEDGTEGGDGSWNNDSDPVDVPDLPSLDISDLGGINLYKVTAQDVKTLMAYLGSAAPGDNILKWFNNPIQGIVSLHVLPYPVNSASSGAGITVLGMPTGAAGFKINQFQEWDLGGVHVDYGFGNCFLDYEPYSHCQIYLPFIGIRSLDMDEVVGQTVSVTYQFDNVSGACIAFIRINSAVRYSFSGSCAIGIPISQSNWGQSYMAVATIAAGGIAGAVGAGAGAMAGATSVSDVTQAGLLGLGAGAAKASGLGAAIGKPTISRSGSISGAASALGVPYPYLIIERPEKAKVANPAPVTGLACGRTLSLASLTGYNIIEHVHLHGIAATGEELQEIERLLYEGVVF